MSENLLFTYSCKITLPSKSTSLSVYPYLQLDVPLIVMSNLHANSLCDVTWRLLERASATFP